MRLDPDDPRAPYKQIAEAIRRAIISGEYEPGSRLPSVTELKEQFSVAAGTVQAAIRLLSEQGYVVTRHGSGTYVRTVLPTTEPAPDAEYAQRLDELAETVRQLTTRVEQLERTTQARAS